MLSGHIHDELPDVRDGLTKTERTILYVLYELRKEYGERHIPSALVYGRVVELIDMSEPEMQRIIGRLTNRHAGSER